MNKTTWSEVWHAFVEYCNQPKTLWDIKDYTIGFLLVFGVLLFITWLVVVLNSAS